MTAGVYFLKYAYPAAGSCILYGKDKIKELEIMVRKEQEPEREELERLFPKAFQRIKRLAEKIGKNYWDLEVIKEYWLREHNRLIDAKEDGYEQGGMHDDNTREFCKISLTEVLDVEQEEGIRVKAEYLGKQMWLRSFIKPKIGDRVTVHKGFVVEILGEKDIEKYFN
jgi:hydrogenase maturation factor